MVKGARSGFFEASSIKFSVRLRRAAFRILCVNLTRFLSMGDILFMYLSSWTKVNGLNVEEMNARRGDRIYIVQKL